MTGIEKTASIMIKKPLMEVFNYVANPDNFQFWQTDVIDSAITSQGPMAVGSTYRYSFQAMGQTIETTGVITEYLPFRKYAYKSTSGPFPIEGGFSFEKAGDFIKVTAFGAAEPGGYFSMAKMMIGIMLSRQLNASLQKLKETLEGSG